MLGVDPGTVATGWGLVAQSGRTVRHVASGVLRLRGARAARLGALYRTLGDLCACHRPAVIVLENTFVGDNIQSAFRLGEARGAVMVAAALAALPVTEYSPAEIKVAVTGSGRASKEQMQAMVARLLGLATPPAADAADALAAAICHLHRSRFAARLAAWGSAAAPTGRAPRRTRALP